VDASEIKAAVAHKASAAAAAQAPFVNHRDPARALGPDGRPPNSTLGEPHGRADFLPDASPGEHLARFHGLTTVW
jgi:hypothetical protein